MVAFKQLTGIKINRSFYAAIALIAMAFGGYFFYINDIMIIRNISSSILLAIVLFEAIYRITSIAILKKYRSFVFSGISIVIFAVLMNFAIGFLNMDTLVVMIQDLSDTDALTKIHNRRYFFNRLVEKVDLMRRDHEPFVMAIFDIDDFKKVNDAYGHVIGDEVLVEFAAYIKEQLRKIDIVARYGGEEFIVLIRVQAMTDAQMILNRIHKRVYERTFSSKELKLTFSGGAVLIGLEHVSMNPDEMVDIADKRLYYAKETGKNKIVVNAVEKPL